jgi:hypothetical protein
MHLIVRAMRQVCARARPAPTTCLVGYIPWAAQSLRAEIFATCKVLEERADGEGAFLRVRGAPALRGLFAGELAAQRR